MRVSRNKASGDLERVTWRDTAAPRSYKIVCYARAGSDWRSRKPAMADVQCPKFDSDSGKWGEWVELFNSFALLKDWDDAKKLQALPFFLNEAALQIFRSLGEAQRATWDAANAALLPIFQREATNGEASFYVRRQETGETLSMFAINLRRLAGEAFGEYSQDSLEKIMVKQFLRGIHPDLATETARKAPHTLDTAVTHAQAALEIRNSIRDIQSNHQKLASCSAANTDSYLCASGRGDSDDRLQRLENKIEQLSNAVAALNISSGTPQRNSEVRVRWRSPSVRGDKNEHFGREESKLNRRPSTPDRKTPRQGRNRRCYECGEYEHLARDCPVRNRFQGTRGSYSGN